MPRSPKAHALPREILCGILFGVLALCGAHANEKLTLSTGMDEPYNVHNVISPTSARWEWLRIISPLDAIARLRSRRRTALTNRRNSTGANATDTNSTGAIATNGTSGNSTMPKGNETMPKHFVVLTVTMPYSKAEFDTAKQEKYKAAMASAARTTADKVGIMSITEKKRRQAASINVETAIIADNAAGADALVSALGTGDALKAKINAELTKQGLKESTGVTNPVLGNPPRDVAELQVAPRAAAKLKISGTQYELEIKADTFLGACNISLEALTYSTTMLTFLDLSFVHSGASRVLLFDYDQAGIKPVKITLPIESPATSPKPAARRDGAKTVKEEEVGGSGNGFGRRLLQASTQAQAMRSQYVFWLDKQNIIWNPLCDSKRNVSSATVFASIPSDILNGNKFNPTSSCATAITNAGYCNGTGGMLMLQTAPDSICGVPSTTPLPAVSTSLPVWQIVAIALCCLIAFTCVAYFLLTLRSARRERERSLARFHQQTPLTEKDTGDSKQVGLGLVLQYVGGNVVVEDVIPGYGSAIAQIQSGDILTEVDGVEVAGKDPEFLKYLTLGPDMSSCTLGIYRDGFNYSVPVRRYQPPQASPKPMLLTEPAFPQPVYTGIPEVIVDTSGNLYSPRNASYPPRGTIYDPYINNPYPGLQPQPQVSFRVYP